MGRLSQALACRLGEGMVGGERTRKWLDGWVGCRDIMRERNVACLTARIKTCQMRLLTTGFGEAAELSVAVDVGRWRYRILFLIPCMVVAAKERRWGIFPPYVCTTMSFVKASEEGKENNKTKCLFCATTPHPLPPLSYSRAIQSKKRHMSCCCLLTEYGAL